MPASWYKAIFLSKLGVIIDVPKPSFIKST